MKQEFNVIIYDFNSNTFITRNVLEYLEEEFKSCKKVDSFYINNITSFVTLDKFLGNEDYIKNWVDIKLMSKYWSRCEYEIILSGWPPKKDSEKKIDVYWQCKMNFNLIVELFKQNIKDEI